MPHCTVVTQSFVYQKLSFLAPDAVPHLVQQRVVVLHSQLWYCHLNGWECYTFYCLIFQQQCWKKKKKYFSGMELKNKTQMVLELCLVLTGQTSVWIMLRLLNSLSLSRSILCPVYFLKKVFLLTVLLLDCIWQSDTGSSHIY